jgi:hypothetical protein
MKISEKIAKLRKELKDLGYNNRKISVTNGGGNLESSIRVHFKFTPTEEEISKVRKIAIQYKEASYCPVSGDFLAGGNTFVHISYLEKDGKTRYV